MTDLSDATSEHTPEACPECFSELQRDRDWWQARPEGSRLVGLVIARPDMPTVFEQREALTRFGVPIEGFRHPAPETLESWEDRLARLFGRLGPGDVLVTVNLHALGRDTDEETRTLRELRGRGVIVKVLAHGGQHLQDATV
ncbi:dehydrogenase [Microbacterium sp.]|uniref:dehydrogenase n=1 Tax=Microbacterium sp. TaxID=51671 RepID=UPI003221EB7C